LLALAAEELELEELDAFADALETLDKTPDELEELGALPDDLPAFRVVGTREGSAVLFERRSFPF
jgi:hypothetical protein